MSKNMETGNPQEGDSGFKKEIGLFSGINVLVGIIIGSGVFYLGSHILLNTKMSMGYALLAWIIGGLGLLLGGVCFAELGAMMPKAGGMYVYLSEGYHPVVGFMNEWTSILISGAGSNAALAIAFPTALAVLLPMSEVTIKVLAVISILVLSAINYVGVKFGAWVKHFHGGQNNPANPHHCAGHLWGNPVAQS